MNLNKILESLRCETEEIKIMEVCGTHTSSIYKNGIRDLLSSGIRLVSGPGCPVCVTSVGAIDQLLAYAMQGNCTILSFGDMMRVKGSKRSLSEAKAEGANVHLMYSPLEVVSLATQNTNHQFIVAAVGFETTIPIYAVLLDLLIKQNITNVKLYTICKTMPEVLEYVCINESIDAFLCPGHVSVIVGSNSYQDLCDRYKKPFVIAGFEAEHILTAIYEIMIQKKKGIPQIKNLYKSVVTPDGQKKALELINKYFIKSDTYWRGIGEIKNSGYLIREEFARFSANKQEIQIQQTDNGCRCSEVILGRIMPDECTLFKTICNPENPVGACMVSSEGTCRICCM